MSVKDRKDRFNMAKKQVIVYHPLVQGNEIPLDQKRQINKFLRLRGWTSQGKHLIDRDAENVAVVQRRTFRNLLQLTEEKNISTIVCHSPKIFCPNPLERGLATNLLREYGLFLIYATGEDQLDIETQQLLQIISIYQKPGLKLETGRRRRRRKSVTEGNLDLRGRGKVGGRKSYKEIDTVLVEKVKCLRKKSFSLRKIADLLEKKGYTNGKGNKFNPSQISRILLQ